MEIIYKNIDELIPYDNNPRINDEAVEYVKNSIKEFGFKVPVVIDKDNVIIAGHSGNSSVSYFNKLYLLNILYVSPIESLL